MKLHVCTLIGFCLLIGSALAQDGGMVPDSVVVNQVQRLIKTAQALAAAGKADQAMDTVLLAQAMAVERFGRDSKPFVRALNGEGLVFWYQGKLSETERCWLEVKSMLGQLGSKEDAEYATAIANLGVLYFNTGQFDQAEANFLEARSIRERVLDKNHPDQGATMKYLGALYHSLGQYEKSAVYITEYRDILEKTHGKTHVEYGSINANLGFLYLTIGQYDMAEPLLLESKQIIENAVGKEHHLYVVVLKYLGELNLKLTRFQKAAQYYQEGKSVEEKTVGKDHYQYVGTLNALGLVHYNLGQYDKAEALYLEAKEMCDEYHGIQHMEYSAILNNLGILYSDRSHYERAEAYYLEAMRLYENQLGKAHPKYGTVSNNLGILYQELGQYERAEKYFLEALASLDATFDKAHPDYALTLVNLSTVYLAMGQFERAERNIREGQLIWQNALEEDHLRHAMALNSIGSLYGKLGAYAEAEFYFLKSKEIREKQLGRNHFLFVVSLRNLATLYLDMGELDRAEQYYLEAQSILDSIVEKDHPEWALTLGGIGSVHLKRGDYVTAESFLEESRHVLQATKGTDNPSYAQALYNLSTLYCEWGQYARAEALIDSSARIRHQALLRSVPFLSEKDLGDYLISENVALQRIPSFLHSGYFSSRLAQLAYDNVLFQKGFLMQAASRLRSLGESSPEAVALSNQLKGYRRQIVAEMSRPLSERQDVKEWEIRANELENELARTVAGYAEAMRQVRWEEVRAALPSDAVALEFIHYSVQFPRQTDSVHYGVLLLRPGNASPEFIPLFEEGELMQLVEAFPQRRADYAQMLYGSPAGQGAATSLYALIWEKIEAAGLEGVQTIYYAPSGVLHRLNLSAMMIDETQVLADRYSLFAMISTRQLVVPDQTKNAVLEAVLVGGVDFNAWEEDPEPQGSETVSLRDAGEAWSESATRGEGWVALKWTRREVDSIAVLLAGAGYPSSAYTGAEASEEQIKAIGTGGTSPAMLHFATHGFFFPDPQRRFTTGNGGEGFEPALKWTDNPMMRSGLILAGGNYGWRHGRSPGSVKEDGILTAYEISQMNLRHTQLVVLSACETGLGDIMGNEGVYGLQRAFKIAGAKYLIMSLWQVSDKATMAFMTTFYRHWLQENHDVRVAFAKTQKEARERFKDPFVWAGFVLIE